MAATTAIEAKARATSEPTILGSNVLFAIITDHANPISQETPSIKSLYSL